MCSCISQNYNYTHLSAGDLLREERAREGSEFGHLIASFIKEGKIVPVGITINLLKKVGSQSVCNPLIFLITPVSTNTKM